MADRLRGLLAWLLIFGLTGWIVQWTYRGRGTMQPIAYNHKKHIDLGLECAFCHTGIADQKARAGIPDFDVCLACHTPEDENPKAKRLQEYASKNQLVPWKKIYGVPNHVFFSHRRHVGIAKLDCAVCHGNMAAREEPVTRQEIPISMERCMDCHKKSQVTNDCLACHR